MRRASLSIIDQDIFGGERKPEREDILDNVVIHTIHRKKSEGSNI